jgi:hypothetical protein
MPDLGGKAICVSCLVSWWHWIGDTAYFSQNLKFGNDDNSS